MTSDAKIASYIRDNTPDGKTLSEEEIPAMTLLLKDMTSEQLSYLTRNTAEPT